MNGFVFIIWFYFQIPMNNRTYTSEIANMTPHWLDLIQKYSIVKLSINLLIMCERNTRYKVSGSYVQFSTLLSVYIYSIIATLRKILSV